MKVVGIETSGIQGGIALIENNTTRKVISLQRGMVHGKLIIPTLHKAIKQCRWTPADIDLIAVDIGPGSYTGLRVGLAVAKMMSYLLDKPIIGVPSLDAMAAGIKPKPSQYLCPIIDARWNQVYAAVYKPQVQRIPTPIRTQTGFLATSPANLLKILLNLTNKQKNIKILMFGDGLIPYTSVFKLDRTEFSAKQYWHPKAINVARLGLMRWQNGQRDDYRKLLPLYLRPTEAEVNLKRQARRWRRTTSRTYAGQSRYSQFRVPPRRDELRRGYPARG